MEEKRVALVSLQSRHMGGGYQPVGFNFYASEKEAAILVDREWARLSLNPAILATMAEAENEPPSVEQEQELTEPEGDSTGEDDAP